MKTFTVILFIIGLLGGIGVYLAPVVKKDIAKRYTFSVEQKYRIVLVDNGRK